MMLYKIILFTLLGIGLSHLAIVWIRVLKITEKPELTDERLAPSSKVSASNIRALLLDFRLQTTATKGERLRFYGIEGMVALLVVACLFKFESYIALKGVMLVIGLTVASIIDFEYCIIPDNISIGGTIIGLLLPGMLMITCCYEPNMLLRAWIDALIGAAIGSAMLMWLSFCMEVLLKKEAMGFGDVKLMGFIGSFCGWKGALFAIFGGSVIGTLIVGLATLLSYILSLTTPLNLYKPLRLGQTLPFGPWLSVGALSYYLLIDRDLSPYETVLKALESLII